MTPHGIKGILERMWEMCYTGTKVSGKLVELGNGNLHNRSCYVNIELNIAIRLQCDMEREYL